MRDLAVFGRSYLWTPPPGKEVFGYMAMRRLFCATNGRLNDVVAWTHRLRHPPRAVSLEGTLIPGLNAESLRQVVEALDRHGYYVFPEQLPADLVQQLRAFALQANCRLLGRRQQDAEEGRFDPEHPVAVRYEIAKDEIVNSPVALNLMTDPGPLAISQAYFRAQAMQDLVGMWWSAPAPEASSEAAQLYHFDLDRIKWLNFFIYLTDVDTDTGPHCFVDGSHRRLPRAFQRDSRFTDEEVAAHYARDRLVEITGPAGTVSVVDTRGLHKGKPLRSRNRLMFQISYVINQFGMHYPPANLTDESRSRLDEAATRYPWAFASYMKPGNERNPSEPKV